MVRGKGGEARRALAPCRASEETPARRGAGAKVSLLSAEERQQQERRRRRNKDAIIKLRKLGISLDDNKGVA